MIVIIDYGVGNLFSLVSSFKAIGEDVIISKDAEVIEKADKLILPGVGAFSDASKKLKESGLEDVIKKCAKSGKPLLGVCLGMQLLFEKSFEYGEYEGLGLIKGEIRPISDVIGSSSLKIPHMGWNKLKLKEPKSDIFKYINTGDFVYFVHSYCGVNCDESIIAVTEYGEKITAAVQKDNVYGCQFHPEKSGDVGVKILKAFCEK